MTPTAWLCYKQENFVPNGHQNGMRRPRFAYC